MAAGPERGSIHDGCATVWRVAAAHELVGLAVIVGALVVFVTATWSAATGRRSSGRRDHRLATDRAILVVLGLLVAAGLLGVALLVMGSRPTDPLHFLYAVAGLVCLPAAIWIGAGRPAADSTRVRRDTWTAGGAVVLFGIGLRLLATG